MVQESTQIVSSLLSLPRENTTIQREQHMGKKKKQLIRKHTQHNLEQNICNTKEKTHKLLRK